MNRYDWNNPPPPGTEFDPPDEDSNFSSQKNDSTRGSDQGSNQIDLPVKSPVTTSREIGEIELSSEKTRMRSRSMSVERRRRRRRSRSYSRRSRSYSKDRRRRSRSRSKHRRRKRSSTRSRSRSASYRRRYRKHSRRHSRSRSRSQSRTHSRRTKSRRSKTRSRSHSRSRSYRSDKDRKSPKSKHSTDRKANEYIDKELDGDIVGEEDMKIEEPDEEALAEQDHDPDQGPIPFKNDGSFLEMFKKMQEQQKAKEEPPQEVISKKPLLPTFGKRRGGKVLKTGMVAKVRNIEEDSNNAQDAWSVYMKEVRKYKEVHCDDDSKTRPLVK